MFKKLLNYSLIIFLISGLMFANVACSSKKNATAQVTHTDRGPDGTISETETTTVQVDAPQADDDDDDGKGLFGILGDIIALPFRVLGALF